MNVKSSYSEYKCSDDNGLYNDDKIEKIISNQVTIVEQNLNLQSSDQRYENMTAKSLKHAAEMFIYLGVCPGLFAPWLKFYNTYRDSIFSPQLASHPEDIMLTLNRIMKAPTPSNNDNLAIKRIAQRLLEKMVSLLSMKFGEIQSGKMSLSFGNNTVIESLDKKGKIYYRFLFRMNKRHF